MIKGIYSINVAVKDFEKAAKKYEEVLKVKPKFAKETEFAFPNLVGANFELGGVFINVIGSKTDDTSIARFLDKQGEGVFLVSLLVDEIEKDVDEMKQKGLNFVTPITDVHLGKVTFAHPKSFHGVQLEVLQLKE